MTDINRTLFDAVCHERDLYYERIKVLEASLRDERQRCADIVSAARFDEIERDWRSLIDAIESGITVAQLKGQEKASDT